MSYLQTNMYDCRLFYNMTEIIGKNGIYLEFYNPASQGFCSVCTLYSTMYSTSNLSTVNVQHCTVHCTSNLPTVYVQHDNGAKALWTVLHRHLHVGVDVLLRYLLNILRSLYLIPFSRINLYKLKTKKSRTFFVWLLVPKKDVFNLFYRGLDGKKAYLFLITPR